MSPRRGRFLAGPAKLNGSFASLGYGAIHRTCFPVESKGAATDPAGAFGVLMFKTLTPPAESAVGEQEFRNALRHFASGVTVITAVDATGAVHGMTATAFCSLSLRPPLVLVAIAHGTRCHKLIRAERRFGVSILHDAQVDLSRHFGGQGAPGAAPGFKTLGEVPVLDEAMVTLACSLEDFVDGGDHSIFIGLVTAAAPGKGQPLIHFGGRYRKLAKT